MKAYIERPMTDMPEKEGYYTVIYTESTAGSDSFYFLDDEWFDTYPEAVDEHADPIDVDGLVWLQEIEIPDPSPVNTDVLVEKLKNLVARYEAMISDRVKFEANAKENNNEAAAAMWRHKREGIERAAKDIAELLAVFTTPQPDKKEEKK